MPTSPQLTGGQVEAEAKARQRIGELPRAAGCEIQDREAINLGASCVVAVREFPLQTGEADYLLFVDCDAAGDGAVERICRYSLSLGKSIRGYQPGEAAVPFEGAGADPWFL